VVIVERSELNKVSKTVGIDELTRDAIREALIGTCGRDSGPSRMCRHTGA
jgi:hypothetical protein